MRKLTILFLSTALFFSCKKKDDCSTNVASISGTYRITAYSYKQTPTSSEVDYYSTIFPDACDRDNTLMFNTNGTYLLTDAGVVCNPSGNDNGTWSLSGNTMTVDSDPTTIESFDCKTLIIYNTDIMTTGDKLKITLVKQ